MKKYRKAFTIPVLTITFLFGATPGLQAQTPKEKDSRPDIFQQFDRNGDGLIEPSEFPGEKARFQELDRNGDGFLSREELHSTNPQLPDRYSQSNGDSSQAGGPKGPGGPGGMGGPGGPGAMGGPPPKGQPEDKGGKGFEEDDADKDGRVSRQEFSGPAELFDRLDQNGDGYISRDELPSPGEGNHRP